MESKGPRAFFVGDELHGCFSLFRIHRIHGARRSSPVTASPRAKAAPAPKSFAAEVTFWESGGRKLESDPTV